MKSVPATKMAFLFVAAMVDRGLAMEPDRRAEGSPKRMQGATSLAAMAHVLESALKQYEDEKALNATLASNTAAPSHSLAQTQLEQDIEQASLDKDTDEDFKKDTIAFEKDTFGHSLGTSAQPSMSQPSLADCKDDFDSLPPFMDLGMTLWANLHNLDPTIYSSGPKFATMLDLHISRRDATDLEKVNYRLSVLEKLEGTRLELESLQENCKAHTAFLKDQVVPLMGKITRTQAELAGQGLK